MNYPNNGFISYVNLLYQQFGLKPTPYFLVRALKISPVLLFRVIKDTAIELIFLLIFWAVIVKMSQGRDLIISLFEPDGLYGYKRIFFTSLAVLSYSLSMWIIPAFLFQLREKKNPGLESPFHKHLFFVHRVLPLVPFWLLASAFFRDNGWMFILGAIIEMFLLYLYSHVLKSKKIKKWIVIGVSVLLAILICYFYWQFQKQYTEMKVLYAIDLYLSTILMFIAFNYVDDKIIEEHKKKKEDENVYGKYKVNSWAYFIIIGLHVFVLFCIYWVPFKMRIAPESMLLYMFSVYVFAIDLFVYLVQVSMRRRVIASGLIIIFLFLLSTKWWDIETRQHTMHANADSTYSKGLVRDDFNKRYEELRKKIIEHDGQYPIILVSGEGGGSRAGMWFSQNLINFDYQTKGQFRKYIFSISTVSGSSVGLSTLYSFWDKTRDADSIPEKWLKLPSKVYANNYVGSSIRGLLLMDLYKSLVPYPWRYNRNTSLQNEEAKTTAKAMMEINDEKDYDDADINDSLLTLKRDLMYFFYDNPGGQFVYRENTPITLINTCRANDGRRGIFSSIRLSDSYFHEAIDIAGYLYEDFICNDKGKKICQCNRKPISLVQACNTSELFPVLSAPAYIDSLGSFVDGGYHENSGLKSTLDIYQQLLERLQNDTIPREKYKIYIMYLKNGSAGNQLYRSYASEPTALMPLTALFNQPFVGSAAYFEERARSIDTSGKRAKFIAVNLDAGSIVNDSALVKYEEQNPKDSALEREMLNDMIGSIVVREDKKTKDTILNFPLARWLSRTIIKRINLKASPINSSNDVKELLALINAANKTQKPTADAFLRLTTEGETRK